MNDLLDSNSDLYDIDECDDEEKEEAANEIDKMVDENDINGENGSGGDGPDLSLLINNNYDLDVSLDPNIVSGNSFQYSLYAYPVLAPDY